MRLTRLCNILSVPGRPWQLACHSMLRIDTDTALHAILGQQGKQRHVFSTCAIPGVRLYLPVKKHW